MYEMSARNKILKRTVVSKQRNSNDGFCACVNRHKKRQTKTPGYLNNTEGKKSPNFFNEVGFENTDSESESLDSAFSFPDFYEESKHFHEFNSDFYHFNRKFSAKNPCCFCKKFKSLLSEQQLSSAGGYFLNSRCQATSKKFTEGYDKQTSPVLARQLNHKTQSTSTVDWFDNHAVPQYILGISNLMNEWKGLSQLGDEQFSRVICCCTVCNKNRKKVINEAEKRTRKKCSRCGIPVEGCLDSELSALSKRKNDYRSCSSS